MEPIIDKLQQELPGPCVLRDYPVLQLKIRQERGFRIYLRQLDFFKVRLENVKKEKKFIELTA